MNKKVKVFLSTVLISIFSMSLFPNGGELISFAQENQDGDSFRIGAYWGPDYDYTNAEQYDYLKDANINFVQNVCGADDLQKSNKILELCKERGLKVAIGESRLNNIQNATDEQIDQLLNDYKDNPATDGYNLADEPAESAFDNLARVYKKIVSTQKNAVPYVNLLPTYANLPDYEDYIDSWVEAVGPSNLKYLSFDHYPYSASAGTVSEQYFQNLNYIRKAGLKYNVKTACFLQSIGIPGSLRRPNENELRYNVFTSLAYGVKQASWFTWFTPTNRSETFTDGIITADGKKTDLYVPVQKLNLQMKTLGPTLMKMDAKEVFHSGSSVAGADTLPENYFWQPVNSNDDILISHFVDKTTGRNYIMVVNKSISNKKTFSFKLDKSISKVEEISKTTGSAVDTNYNASNNTLSSDFLPGEGKLYVLPEDFHYTIPTSGPTNPTNPTNPTSIIGQNLAFNKKVKASSDVGAWGWSVAGVVDGNRDSSGSLSGWTSCNDIGNNHEEWIYVDLGKSYDINRVDLYPRNSQGMEVGYCFPIDFTIQVSNDAVNWKTIATRTDYKVTGNCAQKFSFDTLKARYVKVDTTKLSKQGVDGYRAQLAEIEIGNVGNKDFDSFLKCTATASSCVTNDWLASYACDNNRDSVWSSDCHGTSDAEEWIAMDTGAKNIIKAVDLIPRVYGLGFPIDFKFQYSDNGTDWKDVEGQSYTNYTDVIDSKIREFRFEKPVNARYIRMLATKLKAEGSNHYFQLAEFKVLTGSIVLDKPTVNVVSGSYNSTQKVTLSSAQDDTTIYYTTDGTDPTENSNKYVEPIIVDKDTTVKYMAMDSHGNTSDIQTEKYVIDKVAPNISVTGIQQDGVYTGSVKPQISVDEGEYTVLCDGKAYNGEEIKDVGKHTLTINAVDKAGNKSTKIIYFTIANSSNSNSNNNTAASNNNGNTTNGNSNNANNSSNNTTTNNNKTITAAKQKQIVKTGSCIDMYVMMSIGVSMVAAGLYFVLIKRNKETI